MILCYFLQVLAILPSPSVILFWAAEQANTVFFGGSPKATHLRTLTALAVNVVAWGGLHLLDESIDRRVCIIICGCVAFISSLNYLQALGLESETQLGGQALANDQRS